ncbi:hypothetical protein [Clostridium sp. HBUAS56010]|uniref:hypothetical protein n=1 Tax=Clostridium sp. HBUAS56010 TaxID=2571127 RepID=UPI0011774B58|nr:hypothetical protein [Clostridium sp. HBUAS56010]
MLEQTQRTPELMEALGNAWSCSDRPPGKYIGSMVRGGKNYYYYKNGLEYYYETDFDREMRQKAKERRWNREQRMGKTNY